MTQRFTRRMTRGRVPKARGAVVARGDQALPVRAEAGRVDTPFMFQRGGNRLAGVRIPDLRRIPRRDHDQPAIRAELNRVEVIRLLGMRQRVQQLAGTGLPDPGRLVPGESDNSLASIQALERSITHLVATGTNPDLPCASFSALDTFGESSSLIFVIISG